MKHLTPKFDFDDILIVPTIHSPIASRYKDIELPKMLPLFTAPMDTVVNLNNSRTFINNKINVCLPRTTKYNDFVVREIINGQTTDDGIFISLGFQDIDVEIQNKFQNFHKNAHILIDVANGHMEKILEYCKEIKKYRPDIITMVGNIANPDTYYWYAESQCVDYIRVGIGNGGGCWLSGTKIKTKNKGYVNIEDIVIGDMVLTHNKTYQEVISKTSYVTPEKLFEINGEICTEEHEIYVINKKDILYVNDDNYEIYCYWITAKNLDENQHCIVSLEEDV